MRTHLAFDVGGTNTRCLAVTDGGAVLGFGKAAGGNPNAVGAEAAAHNILLSARQALGRAARSDSENSSADPQLLAETALLAMAGAAHGGLNRSVADLLEREGLARTVSFRSDMLAAYVSGTMNRTGVVLASGTGAVASAVDNWDIVDFSDGAGWLVGDYGSGFWLAQEGLRAAVNDLLGRGRPTALTQNLAAVLVGTLSPDRSTVYRELLAEVYRDRPVSLARVAPMVMSTAEDGDPIALDIVERAARELLITLDSVVQRANRESTEHLTVVLAGSILDPSSPVGQRVRAELTTRPAIQVENAQAPLVGAALVLLESLGVEDAMPLRSQLGAAIR